MLKHFWQGYYNNYGFEAYGKEHLIVLYVLAILIILMVLFKNKITPKADRLIKVISSSIAVTCELLFHVWNYINDENFLGNLFYFDLCSITLILSVIFNLKNKLNKTQKQHIFELLYFWGIGAIAALTFPALIYGANKFRFYHFFIIHSYIVLTTCYGLIIEKCKISFKSFLYALKTLIFVAVLVAFIDKVFDQNYMYLSHAPETVSPLDDFGEGLEYYFNFGVVTSGVAFLFYLPCGIVNLIKSKASSNMVESDMNLNG
ncbi:MAG: TIGR02206 family membrane protein [Oscillospiraceae bacterium]